MTARPSIKAPGELPEHLERVRVRWEHLEGAGHAALLARVEHFNTTVDHEARTRANDAAYRAQSMPAKVAWLRADAAEVLRAAGPVSACKRGCGHCCHIGVTVSKAEAEVIGRSIGRKVAKPPADRVLDVADMMDTDDPRERLAKLKKQQAWLRDAYHGQACTFLSPLGACTIYEARPLICRWQVSLDTDALLCELVPQEVEPVRVPYLDMSNMHAVYAANFGASPMADIRDWFPTKGAA
jgi:uncharacterized protein